VKFWEAVKAMMEYGRLVQCKGDHYRIRHGILEFFYHNKEWLKADWDVVDVLGEFQLVEVPKPVRRVAVVAVKTNLKAYEHDPFYIRLDRELKSDEQKFPLKFDPSTQECYVEIKE